jgi:hypothetical protein
MSKAEAVIVGERECETVSERESVMTEGKAIAEKEAIVSREAVIEGRMRCECVSVTPHPGRCGIGGEHGSADQRSRRKSDDAPMFHGVSPNSGSGFSPPAKCAYAFVPESIVIETR